MTKNEFTLKNSSTLTCFLCSLLLLLFSCDTATDQKNRETKEQKEVVNSISSSNADTLNTKTSAGQIMDSSGQNYVYSTAGDLQIIGDEFNYDIILPTDVLFDFDKSELRTEGIQLLEKVKQHFKTHKTDQVHIKGHTDSKGSDQYNYLLSQKRAKAVCDWLKKEVGGFNNCIGRGEAEPLVPNENPDGSDNTQNRQRNSRVTISVIKYPHVNKMLEDAEKNKNQGRTDTT